MKITLYILAILLIFSHKDLSAATADEVIRETTDRVLEQLVERQDELDSDPGAIKQVVNDLIIPHFDFQKMSSLVLGRHWMNLDDHYKDCFSSGFRNILVERYAYILLSYDNHRITYEFDRVEDNTDTYFITQTISRDRTVPLPIKYAMQESLGEWKVVDLIIDGVSLVRNYLGMYQSQIHTQGLEYFIENYSVCNNQ
jgi:phospholipid transport system substrate-binding protein